MNAQMTNFMRVLTSIILILQTACAFADTTSIRLRGIVSPVKGDTVTLNLYPTYCFDGIEPYVLRTFTDAVRNGHFELTIGPLTKPSYISLSFSSKDNRKSGFQLYLVEPGDDVLLTVSDTGKVFTGMGSTKYNCQYRLNQFIPKFTDLDRQLVITKGGEMTVHDSVRIAVNAAVSNRVHDEQLRLLRNCREELSSEIYEQLYTDYLFDIPTESITSLNNLSFAFTPEMNIKDRIHYQILRSCLPKLGLAIGIDTRYLKQSRSFTSFALQTLLSQRLMRNYGEDQTSRFASIKAELDATFSGSGTIYKHLLAAIVVRYYRADVEPTVIAEIEKTDFQDSVLSHLVKQVVGTKSYGRPAFPFVLMDTRGDTIRLRDFADKVVVMDFWFTGCVWCKVLEKKMKPIKEVLKSDDRIVFISINLDKDREEWLTSIAGGEYTDLSSVNLFTDGLRFRHPLPKHYGFLGAPQQLVLNKKHQVVMDNTSFDSKWLTSYLRELANATGL